MDKTKIDQWCGKKLDKTKTEEHRIDVAEYRMERQDNPAKEDG